MKIIQNIPGFIKILFSLPELGKLKREIDKSREAGSAARAAADAARKAGNIEEAAAADKLAIQEENKEKVAILAATDMWGHHLLRSFKIDLTVEGQENLPTKGPVVYVCNHQGFADIPTMCAILNKIQFGFIAKDALNKIPLYGVWMKRIRSVMIKRDDPRASLKAISEGIDYINHGFSMLIFPEGTRAQGGPMNEFKKGALKLATKPGVPIIPISINGTYDVLEKTGVLTPAPINVIIHSAIPTAGISRIEEKELTDYVFNIVKSGVDELKAEKAERESAQKLLK